MLVGRLNDWQIGQIGKKVDFINWQCFSHITIAKDPDLLDLQHFGFLDPDPHKTVKKLFENFLTSEQLIKSQYKNKRKKIRNKNASFVKKSVNHNKMFMTWIRIHFFFQGGFRIRIRIWIRIKMKWINVNHIYFYHKFKILRRTPLDVFAPDNELFQCFYSRMYTCTNVILTFKFECM